MKKVMILLIILLVGLPTLLSAGEREVLKAFEILKVSGGVSDRKYNELLRDAEVELNILKRNLAVSKEFLDTAQECNKEFNRAAFSGMMAKESGIAAERARQPASEIEAAMQPHFDARQQSMKNAAVLLDKLYTYVK
ncbi:MAG: hypothetical protein A2V87_08555 [Deltaproteobacteria bacterium RBG_16_58_17]|nr:MAG: hypothetical protein A2V87_08555 [Deltaproteobacteria bacterium RBG_16_58_17]